MLRVPFPEVIEPPVTLHVYVAPEPALATEALPLVVLAIDAGAVIVAFGLGLTVTVVAAEEALVQPRVVTETL